MNMYNMQGRRVDPEDEEGRKLTPFSVAMCCHLEITSVLQTINIHSDFCRSLNLI